MSRAKVDKVAEQEALISEFIDDARSAMDDPVAGEASLVKVGALGRALLDSVGDEAIAAVDRTTETVHRKNACQKDPNCPAGKVRRLEKIEKAQETEHEALKALYARLSAFMDEVEARLNEYAGESEEHDEDQEFLEERASDFIEENKELLEDPEISSDVLGRIFEHGTDIIVVLGKAYEEAAYEEVPLANSFNEAQNDTSLSPKELLERELPYRRAKKKAQGRYAAFDRFKAFMEEVNERREAKREQERVEAPGEEAAASEPEIEEGEQQEKRVEPYIDVDELGNPRSELEASVARGSRGIGWRPELREETREAIRQRIKEEAEERKQYEASRKLPWWKRMFGVHQEAHPELPESTLASGETLAASLRAKRELIYSEEFGEYRWAWVPDKPSEPPQSPTPASPLESDPVDYQKLLDHYEELLVQLEELFRTRAEHPVPYDINPELPIRWQRNYETLTNKMSWCDRNMDAIEERNPELGYMSSTEGLWSRRRNLASRRADVDIQ